LITTWRWSTISSTIRAQRLLASLSTMITTPASGEAALVR